MLQLSKKKSFSYDDTYWTLQLNIPWIIQIFIFKRIFVYYFKVVMFNNTIKVLLTILAVISLHKTTFQCLEYRKFIKNVVHPDEIETCIFQNIFPWISFMYHQKRCYFMMLLRNSSHKERSCPDLWSQNLVPKIL